MIKKTFLIATVIACSASAILTSCGSKQQSMQQGAPEIATLTVSVGDADLESTYPATIKGKTDIDIHPQVTGFITKVHVDEGQRVHKGQTLFTLDQVQFQAAVDQARAAVNLAQTAVETAQITADNNRALAAKNIISDYARQISDNQLAQAKAQLAQAKAGLVTAQKNLAYTIVTAPCDGVIGSIPNREGSLASPSSQALTTVSDNSEVYAYFSLTEKDMLELTQNGATSLESALAAMPSVSLRLADGTTYPIEGKIATISGVIDNTTGASNVRALFKNTNGLLRSGSTGSIVIPHNVKDVITIPQKASFELQDRRFVYMLNDSNKLVSAPITVYPVNDGKSFVVTSGLKSGDRIAVEGVGTVAREGVTITPVDAAAKANEADAQAAK